MTSSPPAAESVGSTPPHPRHRIFLVEDHPIVRDGLAQLINDEPDLVVCGIGSDVNGSLEAIARTSPSVVLIDLLLGDDDGLDLVRALKTSFPHVRTLVLSMYAESLYAERALRAGARGYVTKLAPTESVLVAIRRVLAGEIYVSEATATRLVAKLVGGEGGGAPARGEPLTPDILSRLSDREFEVFRLIGRGNGPSEIARQLGVSVKTVETHREHIKRKLGLSNGRELLRVAMLNAEADAGRPP
jgi:DNA-binding NarL/FixJ family response regulator